MEEKLFRTVRCYDPAIDCGEDGGLMMGEFAMNRDMGKLRFADPAEAVPIVFVLRHLNLKQRRYVTQASDEAEQRRRAFAYAVVRVENHEARAGAVFEPRHAESDRGMSDLDLERFAEMDVQEIGQVARGRSFLGQGIPLRLPALVSSLEGCQAVLYRSAEQRRASGSD